VENKAKYHVHKDLIIEIVNLYNNGAVWLDKLPPEINAAFFDNPYVENHWAMIDCLMNRIFGNNADIIIDKMIEGRDGEEIYEEVYERE
jgi:hypothetical protein